MSKPIKVLLTGGGSGGHVLPVLAVVQELRKLGNDRGVKFEFLHIGSNPQKEKEMIEKAGVMYDKVATGKVRRYFSLQNLYDFFKVPFGVLQAYFKVKKFAPDVVFGKGGFTSFPVVVAAGWQHIPILIHESDTSPGLANRKLAKFATKIAVGFSRAADYLPSEKVIFTGNPVRQEILRGDKSRGLRVFNFEGGKPVVFITGGSLGARTMNRITIGALPKLLEKFDIIHQCGQATLQDTLDRLRLLFGKNRVKKQGNHFYIKGLGYRLYTYLKEEMADAYAVSDLVISRAGANNLTEIAACKKPSILIPLPLSASRGEQISNAGVFAKAGAGVVLMNDTFTAQELIDTLFQLFSDKNQLAQMSHEAGKLFDPQASHKLAEEIYKLAKNVN